MILKYRLMDFEQWAVFASCKTGKAWQDRLQSNNRKHLK
jgi:hypothetical protein